MSNLILSLPNRIAVPRRTSRLNLLVWLALLAALLCLPRQSLASCSFSSGGAGVGSIALPTSLSPPADAANGVLWSSGWKWFSTGSLSCNSSGVASHTLASGIGAATSNPLIHATNVPGIGVAIFWCNVTTSSCPNDPLSIGQAVGSNYAELSSLNWAVPAASYNIFTQYYVYLVKTGPISAGTLSIPGTSATLYQGTTTSTLTLTGSTTITTPSCTINGNSSISVPLPLVASSDFTDSAPTPASAAKAASFNIPLSCDAGVQVVYEIDGTATSGNAGVLDNASGAGYATGVGVQLLQGDASSTQAVSLGQQTSFGSRTSLIGTMSLPFTAKYYKTVPVANLGTGQVAIAATYTLWYE